MPDTKIARFLDFELDFGLFQLRWKGEQVKIERLPLELLMFLVENQGQLVTREQMREKLWSESFIADEDGINTAVYKIRDALKDDCSNPKCLITVVRKGYRFVAEVTTVVAPKASEDEPAFTGQGETISERSLQGKDVSKRKLLRRLTWCVGGGLSLLLAVGSLKPDLRLETKSTANMDQRNPYGAAVTVRNDSWFDVYDVQPSCSTGYGTSDYKEEIVRGNTIPRISRIPAHGAALIICNLAAAAPGLAAEPYKVNKREFTADIELSYRSLLWFQRTQDYWFWVKPMINGDVEWLQTS
jgi:DNA-binding winged helix-turn-helix (wHTH) protein